MSEGYFCELCGYTTDRKSNLVRHLARKTACNIVTQTPEQNSQTFIQNISQINRKISQTDIEVNDRTCNLCENVFKNKNSLRVHKSRKKCQKEKPDPLVCRRCFKKFPNSHARSCHMSRRTCEQVVSPSPPVAQTINNINNDNRTTNDNRTYNFNITVVNPFGEESMDYVIKDKEFLTKCIKTGYPGMQEMIKNIYFNPEHPENHTVHMPNIRGNLLKIRGKDNASQSCPADKVKYDMMYKAAFPLHNHYMGEFNNRGEPVFEKIRKAITTHEVREDKKNKSTVADRKILRQLDKQTTSTLINSRTQLVEA